MPVPVLIADDDPLVRAGLKMILGGAADIRVVGEVGDGTEVADAVDEHRPDVVLMDIRMPNLDGIAATELLRQRESGPEVVILTTFPGDDNAARAKRAGAIRFLLKSAPPAEIVQAVRAASSAARSPRS